MSFKVLLNVFLSLWNIPLPFLFPDPKLPPSLPSEVLPPGDGEVAWGLRSDALERLPTVRADGRRYLSTKERRRR